MLKEKSLLGGQKAIRMAQQWAQRTTHLKSNQHKDPHPQPEVQAVHHSQSAGLPGKQLQAEKQGDAPDQDHHKSHEGERVRALAENPDHRREAYQHQTGEGQR